MSTLGPQLSRTGSHERPRFVRTLDAVVDHAERSAAVFKRDLEIGDQVIIRTRNSVYWLWALGGDRFAVSGGWFEHNGGTPTVVTVNGCTYGGSLIRHDVAAAPGLFLEFGNRVSTTRIQGVRVIRRGAPGAGALPVC